jgi:uncharacterized Zn-binding protein involved in type VI secretion
MYDSGLVYGGYVFDYKGTYYPSTSTSSSVTPIPMATKPLATVGDFHTCGAMIVSGSHNVFAEKKAVARMGDVTSHGSIEVQGSNSVFVNNRRAIRFGDCHSGCRTYPPHPPVPVINQKTVLTK